MAKLPRISVRRLLAALIVVAALLAFLAVKLKPTHHPRVEIESDGSDQKLARRVLVAELEKLFRTSSDRWKVIGSPGLRSIPCIARTRPYSTSSGRAITATYVFAGWLELRLASNVYPTVAVAQRALPAFGARDVEECRARVFERHLRRAGYAAAEPRAFSRASAKIGDGARTSHIEIPSRFKGHPYTWHVDSTFVRRGRMIVVAGTVVGGSFSKANQALAQDLAKAAASGQSS
jgi:hypothetical protein